MHFWLLFSAIFEMIAPPVYIRCIKYKMLITLVIWRFARCSRERKWFEDLITSQWVCTSFSGIQYDSINVVSYCLEIRAEFTYQISTCLWVVKLWRTCCLVRSYTCWYEYFIWYGYKNLYKPESVWGCVLNR